MLVVLALRCEVVSWWGGIEVDVDTTVGRKYEFNWYKVNVLNSV